METRASRRVLVRPSFACKNGVFLVALILARPLAQLAPLRLARRIPHQTAWPDWQDHLYTLDVTPALHQLDATDCPDHNRIQGSAGAPERTDATMATALGDEEDGTDGAFVTNPLPGGSSVSGRSSNAASCSNASVCGSSRFRRRGRRRSSTASGGDGSSHRSGIAIGWIFPVRRVLNLPHVSDRESRHRLR
jgi:hypothetical protein